MNHEVDVEEIARQFQDRYGLLLAVARRYAPSPDDVYDIVQQVFVEFSRYALQGKIDKSRDPAPLLYQMTKIQAIKFTEERRRYSSETLKAVAEELAEISGTEQPEETERLNEEIALLRRCMEKLPPQSRELIEQYYRREMSMEEISRQSDRKTVSIRSAFCRIRLKLRECIERNIKLYPAPGGR